MNNIEEKKNASDGSRGTGAISSIIFMIITVAIMIILSNFIG